MGQRKRPGGRTAGRETADLSRQPGVQGAGAQRDKAPKASAPRRPRQARKSTAGPAGPGGLGYVLGLDKDEVAEIEWRGEEHPAPAPTLPGRGPRRER